MSLPSLPPYRDLAPRGALAVYEFPSMGLIAQMIMLVFVTPVHNNARRHFGRGSKGLTSTLVAVSPSDPTNEDSALERKGESTLDAEGC